MVLASALFIVSPGRLGYSGLVLAFLFGRSNRASTTLGSNAGSLPVTSNGVHTCDQSPNTSVLLTFGPSVPSNISP